MRIALITDAWHPQVNGVVRILTKTYEILKSLGHEVQMIEPSAENLAKFPCPTYPELRFTINPYPYVSQLLRSFKPEAIHIVTEGPLGWSARRYCLIHQLPFTTSLHTKFPEYIQARIKLPSRLFWPIFRWFHHPAKCTMVTTESLVQELHGYGFKNLNLWSLGVDTGLFQPNPKDFLRLPKPIHLYVGRIAIEKNLDTFLKLDLKGTKIVVGDGPRLNKLKLNYPNVLFPGAKFGEELVRYYTAADVFVFPSKTDTFGLVLLEALACGTPVAAYPVTGPRDVLRSSKVACLNHNLEEAIKGALQLNRQNCRSFALTHSWEASAQAFLKNLCFFH